MTTRFVTGDVYEQMAKLDDGSIDLVVCSPPFYNLRSYLPRDHPDKAKEIGQERTPGEYIDKLLRLAAECRRVLTKYGSFAIEIGDSYCADEDTEILTQHGWLSVDDLRVGDLTMTLNPETRLAEWQPVEAVNRFKARPRRMLHMDSDRGHSSLTTANHRWLTEYRSTSVGGGASRPGERNGFAVLDAGQVAEIRARYEAGDITQAELAGDYGVTQSAVSKIVTGRTWRRAPASSDRTRSWQTRETRSDRFTVEDRVPVAASVANLPTDAKWIDALVEAVAWYWTEGNDRSVYGGARGVWISQSQRVNPSHCDRIRRCMTSLFGPPVERLHGRRRAVAEDPPPQWRETEPNEIGVIAWKLNGAAADVIRGHAPGKVVRPEWLAELTQAQLDLFLTTSLAGDGHVRRNESSLAQSNIADGSVQARRRAESFQIAAIMSGRYATLRSGRCRGVLSWVVHVGTKRYFKPSRTKRSWVVSECPVWCPTTANGSWLARREGVPFFTGNSGSGGSGGDYNPGGIREGQLAFRNRGGDGALPKSLLGVPHAFMLSLVYGRNVLTGESSPAGQWLVRNYKSWVRSNPPVGELGDKERPATSYITVACTDTYRWFDLDAVRMPSVSGSINFGCDPMGAPPLDWNHPVDILIDDVIRDRQKTKPSTGRFPGGMIPGQDNGCGLGDSDGGVRGWHIRRALVNAGFIPPIDAIDQSPKPFRGAHFAVWPAPLVKLLVNELCPRRVCVECGEPSRRIVSNVRYASDGSVIDTDFNTHEKGQPGEHYVLLNDADNGYSHNERQTVGWSLCEHADRAGHRLDGFHSGDTWRPGVVLDPFAGSGTTLMVVSGMGRDSVGIDLDPGNAELARDRGGMFVEVD